MQATLPARFGSDRAVCLAILALGGQGGGVLSDWIVALAESQGWHAQSTSVPGVAQRTGATLYYMEMLPAAAGRKPILALMPTPGDVDVVLAAELMEAGRSMLRGLVTPDRTTLIASTHRSYAVVEKERPGDGISDPVPVLEAAGVAAKHLIAFDMESLAASHGTVISACLFGALAAARALPFGPETFEAVIKAGGKGIDANLKAFRAAFAQAQQQGSGPLVAPPTKHFPSLPAATANPELDQLLATIRTFPAPLHAMLFAAVRRLTDYQDPAYARDYLGRMAELYALDCKHGGAAKGYALSAAAAKYLAVAMAYDDVIRVAELKTAAARFARVRQELGANDGEIVYTTEYMHPRLEEVAGTLPAAIGRWLEAKPALSAWLFRRGRRVRTGTIAWFVLLYGVAALKPTRRRTLRHARELAHIERWLALVTAYAATNYDLAVEIVAARRLVKGYSDTHARGQSKFDRVIAALPLLAGREDAAQWLRRLRAAALVDENGVALDGALKTIATL